MSPEYTCSEDKQKKKNVANLFNTVDVRKANMGD